jgi:ribosomal protein S18 acetylase RimI-like enzyme
LIDFAQIQAQASGKAVLELNVNRGNSAYEFYKKIGFKVVEEVDISYYGYILDDYVMQREI